MDSLWYRNGVARPSLHSRATVVQRIGTGKSSRRLIWQWQTGGNFMRRREFDDDTLERISVGFGKILV